MKNKNSQFSHRQAFTLIELLVVIAIIGILATISVIALNDARARARDVRRVADVKQIQTALEFIFNDKVRYPSNDELLANTIFSTSSSGTTTYMNTIPAAANPPDGLCSNSNNPFIYNASTGGDFYTISYCIGNKVGSLPPGKNCATPYGISTGGACNVSGGVIAGCMVSSWSPDPSTVCNGQSFTQTSNCGSTQIAAGTLTCSVGQTCANGSCSNNQWSCGSPIAYSGGPYNSDGISTTTGGYYRTVLIGTQCWLADNLNVGTMIAGANPQQDNSTLEKYCYNNDPANCAIYGGLYLWGEAMQYSVTPGAQGICPTGWHIPNSTDQNTLEQYLWDPSISPYTCNHNRSGLGCDNAGGKMKEAGTTHWNSPNVGATNSSGFTALGAGLRISTGSFIDQGTDTSFWSSSGNTTDGSDSYALARYLYSAYSTIGRFSDDQLTGASIRCIQN